MGWDSRGCWNDFWCESWSMIFLAKLVLDHRHYEISLGGRLLNLTNNDMWPRFLVVEAADGNHIGLMSLRSTGNGRTIQVRGTYGRWQTAISTF